MYGSLKCNIRFHDCYKNPNRRQDKKTLYLISKRSCPINCFVTTETPPYQLIFIKFKTGGVFFSISYPCRCFKPWGLNLIPIISLYISYIHQNKVWRRFSGCIVKYRKQLPYYDLSCFFKINRKNQKINENHLFTDFKRKDFLTLMYWKIEEQYYHWSLSYWSNAQRL